MTTKRSAWRWTVAFGLAAAAILAFASAASACPCGANCSCGPGCLCGTPAPSPGPTPLRVRRNQSALTAQERADFVGAVRTLKNTFRPGSSLSVYDQFVEQHAVAFDADQAHGGPAFLPWHREFLLRFENELRQVNPNVTLPYWDFTVDTSPTASLWAPDFLGGNGDPNNNFVVTDGPFRQGEWTLIFGGPDLRRNFGGLVFSLPKEEHVEDALGVGQYDAPPFDAGSPIGESFRNHLEGFSHPSGMPELHNRVHLWLGGSSEIVFSPNDPVFWLLHANIDRIWADWQARHGSPYLPVAGALAGHNRNDPMFPFGVRPADVLDHTALGYRYEATPAAVPEPSTLVLFALGASGLLAYRRRRTGG